MTYRLSAHAARLRSWVDHHYLERDRTSDGWIGDLAHRERKSDHNPDRKGIVRAIDIDADLIPGAKDRTAAARLADTLRTEHKKWGLSYIIYNGKITSAASLWKWRRYTGTNPHKAHIHVSFLERPGE